ncbi:MAG: insulinase family protein [Spirochaetaceae bacterium]|jgi:Zn-dependent M16 (insulinase) family peptidase|nr:insulinase family protein [Spirochaetaceae bacterium]
MKTQLQKGQMLDSGFKILDIIYLDEFKADGIYARHEKTKTEVFHIYNDDEENLFAYAFATAPRDSSGAAHIIEHSVLCGSKKYPLKDTFLVLAQGSLQTYLNAWTFPDKTVYPASSINEKDYFNLMAVYGDAVFNPKLDEWTFMQEGHHLEYADGRLNISGVVYNEMKGAYSSVDEYAAQWSLRSVLPDTIYALDSGGDPEHIPNLTYEDFKRFHAERYSPANCRIFLAGNIATEKQLSFLSQNFFDGLENGGSAASPVSSAKTWDAPRSYVEDIPAGAEEKAGVFMSWLVEEGGEIKDTMPLSALAEILLGHDGAPLSRVLIESALGEDLISVCGLENEIKQPVFSAGLRGVDFSGGGIEKKAAEIENLIMNEFKRLVKEGIPKEDIEAALFSLEFSHREIKRAHGPRSLVWLRRAMRGWIHGCPPWETLSFAPRFENLRKSIENDGRYFEKLIQKTFLDNPRRALITLRPDKNFLDKKEEALRKKLAQKEAAFTSEEKKQILEKNKILKSLQNAPDSEEALKTIPHLSVGDLSRDIEIIPRELIDLGGVPALNHKIFTNGITYCDFAFPLDILDAEDYLWIPLFSHCVSALGLPDMNYAEVSSLLARTTGDFFTALHTNSIPRGTNAMVQTPSGIIDTAGRDWIIFRVKTFDYKIEAALELVKKIITEACFSDLRRLRDLVLEMKNEFDSNLANAGSVFTCLRGNRYISRASGVTELWSGFTALEFIHRAAEYDTAEVSRALTKIRDKLVAEAGLFVNITGENPAVLPLIEKNFSSFEPPRKRNGLCYEKDFFDSFDSFGSFNFLNKVAPSCKIKNVPAPEIFSSALLRIGFASLSLESSGIGTKEAAAETVLSHYLSTGALWTALRMEGGAYGANALVNSLEKTFTFSTYRDPRPCESLDAFECILKTAQKTKITDDMLEKIIIGSYAKEKQPAANPVKGFKDFIRFLYNIDDEIREASLKNIISVKDDDIISAAERLYKAINKNSPRVILAGNTEAKKAARKFKTEFHELPA